MKPKESDLTTIATFADGVEASIAQQTLAAEGIDAFVHGDAMATTIGPISGNSTLEKA